MHVVYAAEPFPQEVVRSLFLAGPSPRSAQEADWKREALAALKAQGFDGTVYLPVPKARFEGASSNEARWTYDNQIAWECDARARADVIVFWVPRVIDPSKPDLGMPAFTL